MYPRPSVSKNYVIRGNPLDFRIFFPKNEEFYFFSGDRHTT